MEHRASFSAAEREIERIEARRKKLVEMVMDGVAPSVVKDELNANAARREQLEAQLAATEEPPPLLHPEMVRIYRTKVRGLAKALQEPESRPEATEALRRLVEAIVLAQTKAEGNSRSNCGATWRRCSARPYKAKGRRKPTTFRCKYLWLRGRATGGTCSCGVERGEADVPTNILTHAMLAPEWSATWVEAEIGEFLQLGGNGSSS